MQKQTWRLPCPKKSTPTVICNFASNITNTFWNLNLSTFRSLRSGTGFTKSEVDVVKEEGVQVAAPPAPSQSHRQRMFFRHSQSAGNFLLAASEVKSWANGDWRIERPCLRPSRGTILLLFRLLGIVIRVDKKYNRSDVFSLHLHGGFCIYSASSKTHF